MEQHADGGVETRQGPGLPQGPSEGSEGSGPAPESGRRPEPGRAPEPGHRAGPALVEFAAVLEAAERIAGIATRTPLLPCPWADPDRPLWIKAECLQPIGA